MEQPTCSDHVALHVALNSVIQALYIQALSQMAVELDRVSAQHTIELDQVSSQHRRDLGSLESDRQEALQLMACELDRLSSQHQQDGPYLPPSLLTAHISS